MLKSSRVNVQYLYNKGNVNSYVKNVIKYKLGGYKKDEHSNDYKFLLNRKFGVGRNYYFVLYSEAIDNAGKDPLKTFVDKLEHPIKRYYLDDVFDELMPIMLSETNCKAKILFPLITTDNHWLTGEIIIDKIGVNVSVVIYTHNPYGGGQLSKKNFSILNAALQKIIKKSGLQLKSVNSLVSPFTNPRQTVADDASCGVVVADELLKRITDSSLTISSPYPKGAEQLRLSQLTFLQKCLGEDDLNYQLFKQQVTLKETYLEENILSNHNFVKIPTIEARLTIKELRKNVERVIGSEEKNSIKIDQLKQLEKEHYKPLLHQLAHKKTHEELKDLLLVLNDLGNLTIKLGELSGEVKYYNEAAVFYQYVIAILNERLNEKLISTENKIEFIKQEKLDPHQQLTHIQQLIFSAIGGNQGKMPVVQKEVQINKDFLLALRNKTNEEMQKVEEYYQQAKTDIQEKKEKYQELYVSTARSLFQYIAKEMKMFLSTLYSESEQQMSVIPPCQYSVVGLGSMALKQMTPYSDLEFAILTENENYKESTDPIIQSYFKNLSHLVNFKVINLGKSIIPKSKYDIDMEHLVHRAVNFDLGGKTPLGRNDKPYELIKTIKWMMHYVRNEEDKAVHQDKNLPYILENVCFVYGDKKLSSDYQSNIREFLNTKIKDNKYGASKNCEIRAIKLLLEGGNEINYSKFDSTTSLSITNPKKDFEMIGKPKGDLRVLQPKLLNDEGRLFEVKKDIYRLPDRLVYNIGLYYGIVGGSSLDIVDKLKDQEIITPKAAFFLKLAIIFSTTLRLKTYFYYKAQREYMSTFFTLCTTESEIKEQVKQVFHLPDEDLEENGRLFQYFYTVLPLHEKIDKFCRKHKTLNDTRKKSFFYGIEFYRDNCVSKGLIFYRLGEYKKAQSNLELALYDLDNKGDLQIRLTLGNIYNSFGYTDMALDMYSYCLKMQKLDYKENPHPDVAVILNNIGLVYNAKEEYDQAINYFKDSLKIRNQIFKEEPHPSIAGLLNNLGSAYTGKGKYIHAIKYYEDSLKMRKLIYKENYYPSITASLNNLGEVYRVKRKYDQAINYYNESLEIYNLFYKEEPHTDVAALLNNLGSAYAHKDQYNQAINYYYKSLKMRKLIYKKEPHPYIADSFNNLGAAFADKGQFDQAIKYSMKSIEMRKLIYKDEPHPCIAYTLINLGSAYKAKGQYDQAIEYYEESLKMKKLIYKEANHPSIADSFNILGRVFCDNGQYDKAISYFVESLTINKLFYKEELHEDVAVSLNNLGGAYCDNGNYEQAIKCFEESIKIYKLIYKEKPHSDVADILINLAGAYADKGEFEQAITFNEESIEIYKLVYKEEPHLKVAYSFNNLGVIYAYKGQYDQAIYYYKKSIAIYKLIYEEECHPSIADSFNNLGSAYMNKGQYDQAISCYEESIKMKNIIYNDQPHTSIACSLKYLGAVHASICHYDEAITYYEKSIEMYKLIYEEKPHSSIADLFNSLGSVYAAKQEYDLAIDYYKKSQTMTKLMLRDQPHSSIVYSLKKLGAAYASKGQYDQAINFYKESFEMSNLINKGEADPIIATLLNDIGAAYTNKGQYDQAIKYYENSLEMYKIIYKDQLHPTVANSFNNLGGAFAENQQYDQAIYFFEESLKLTKLIYEDQPNPIAAVSFNNLGGVYAAKEQYDKAIYYFDESLKIKNKIFKEESNPSIASSFKNLASACADIGQHEQANN